MAAAVRSSPVDTMSQPAGKRKRGNEDVGRNPKETKHMQPEDEYSLLQDAVELDSQRAAQDALSYPEANVFDGNLDAAFAGTSPSQTLNTPQHSMYATPAAAPVPAPNTPGEKPGVGSNEWHAARKASHKEGKYLERRRREVINEGIDQIAKIVPGQEKNKGAILQRTLSYILELQDKQKNIEGERQLLQMTINELTSRNDKFRQSCQQAWADAAKWQQRCRDLGGDFDDYSTQMPAYEDDDLGASLAPS